MITKEQLKFIITEWDITSEYRVPCKVTTCEAVSFPSGISLNDQKIIKSIATELWSYRYPFEPIPTKESK